MQLRMDKGYRAIHCKQCKKQETVARTKCQCNLIWHRCEVHRIDPLTHYSRKGRKGAGGDTKARPKKVEGIFGSKRKAPIIIEGKAAGPSRRKRRRKGTVDESLISHARKVMCLYPPGKAAVESLKRKLEGKKEAEDIEVTPRAVQRRLRGKQKEPPLLGTSEDRKRKAREDQETARKEGKKSAENDELEDRVKAKQPTNSAPSEVQNVNPYDARSKVHCAPSESKDGTINGATSSSSSSSRVVQTNPRRLSTKSSSNNKVTVTKRKASDNGGGRNKAREEDAIKRILNTREAEAPKAPDDETDEELIELCWQDLLTDGASQGDRAASEDKFDEANSKRPRCNEPDFDQDPKLPGDSSTTSAISARLWSESRGLRRISIDKHTAIQEGKQSENFAKRTRGASSERASKVHKGTALRIQHDDMHVIHRLIKQGTATSSSGHPRDIDAGSCSSNAGLGGFLKKPP